MKYRFAADQRDPSTKLDLGFRKIDPVKRWTASFRKLGIPTELPKPSALGPGGVVAVGPVRDVSNLLYAYQNGYFPQPGSGMDIALWRCPLQRGVLFFEDLRISRSLRKRREASHLRFTIDACFEAVVRNCATQRGAGYPTWISPAHAAAYVAFHRAGYAHSFEAWDGERLVGGLYCVEVDGIVTGESMFHRETDASKLTLLYFVDYLSARGVRWVDTQMVTEHMASLGARTLPREAFLELHRATRVEGRRVIGSEPLKS